MLPLWPGIASGALVHWKAKKKRKRRRTGVKSAYKIRKESVKERHFQWKGKKEKKRRKKRKKEAKNAKKTA